MFKYLKWIRTHKLGYTVNLFLNELTYYWFTRCLLYAHYVPNISQMFEIMTKCEEKLGFNFYSIMIIQRTSFFLFYFSEETRVFWPMALDFLFKLPSGVWWTSGCKCGKIKLGERIHWLLPAIGTYLSLSLVRITCNTQEIHGRSQDFWILLNPRLPVKETIAAIVHDEGARSQSRLSALLYWRMSRGLDSSPFSVFLLQCPWQSSLLSSFYWICLQAGLH